MDHDTDRNLKQWGGPAVATRGVTTAGVTFRLIPLLINTHYIAPLASRPVKRRFGWLTDLLIIVGFILLAVLTTWPLAQASSLDVARPGRSPR